MSFIATSTPASSSLSSAQSPPPMPVVDEVVDEAKDKVKDEVADKVACEVEHRVAHGLAPHVVADEVLVLDDEVLDEVDTPKPRCSARIKELKRKQLFERYPK